MDGEQYLRDFREVHGDKYDYSKVVFDGSMNHIIIICPYHTEFKQLPLVHRGGHGCPKCMAQATSDRAKDPVVKAKLRNQALENFFKNGVKKSNTGPELKFKEYLNNNGIEFEHQITLVDDYGGNWYFDFYIPTLNLIVETDGEYYHTKMEQYNRDKIKTKLAYARGYRFIRISDLTFDFDSIFLNDEDMKLHNDNIMESRIPHLRVKSNKKGKKRNKNRSKIKGGKDGDI